MSIKRNKKGLIALALVPFVAINFYVGGKLIRKRDIPVNNGNVSNVLEMPDKNNYMEVTEEGSTLAKETEDEKIGSISQKSVFEDLGDEYRNSSKEVEEILRNTRDVNSKLYVSALYEKLKQSGLSDEEIREQIDNILSLSLYATDFPDDEWERLFGKMIRTIGRYENPMDYYYPLARYVHESECSLEHREYDLDENRVVCDNLIELTNETIKKLSYTDYVFQMVYDSNDEELISCMDRILKKCDDLGAVLGELETMYELSQIPMCIPDDVWFTSFKNLLTTVDENDNVFEVYERLALYVHMLNCDFEHSPNEFGVTGCEAVKRLYK